MTNIVINYAAPYSASRELYRIIVYEYDTDQKLRSEFEVWAPRETIDDELGISRPITKSDLSTFARKIYAQYQKDFNGEAKHKGVFVSSTGLTYGDPDTFPGSLPTNNSFVQTNISLPKNLHESIKQDAAENNMSMSELIRVSLMQYTRRSFICSTCQKRRNGDPQIEFDGKKDCRICFLKKFENA